MILNKMIIQATVITVIKTRCGFLYTMIQDIVCRGKLPEGLNNPLSHRLFRLPYIKAL